MSPCAARPTRPPSSPTLSRSPGPGSRTRSPLADLALRGWSTTPPARQLAVGHTTTWRWARLRHSAPDTPDHNFEEFISGNKFVNTDLRAEWCGPCRKFGPVVEWVSGKHEGIEFAKINTEVQRELAQASRSRRSPPS
ncbi:thioredoxin family protein [Streptomyces sp. NPDC057148]|uniref:thioredoxin family protein n=1 Tax=unclassified Streptomyces TaxID=2593676 RepID=UPI0036286650